MKILARFAKFTNIEAFILNRQRIIDVITGKNQKYESLVSLWITVTIHQVLELVLAPLPRKNFFDVI